MDGVGHDELEVMNEVRMMDEDFGLELRLFLREGEEVYLACGCELLKKSEP